MPKRTTYSSLTSDHSKSYGKLTPKLAFQLMAPHTLCPSILAVLFSLIYTITFYVQTISLVCVVVLFVICILMQSTANTFNDYFDYVKGTDQLENSSDDPFDAVLVYNNLNPRDVLIFAISQLICAFLLGIYIIIQAGFIPLIIGIIGAIVVVIYSAGKTPLSYLPIGELVIGFVMGGLIPLACVYTLTLSLDWFVLVASLPLIIGIGMILATNNTCDIEKDMPANRHTLAVVLGRAKAVQVYKTFIAIWMLIIVVLTALFFSPSILLSIIMICAAFPILRALYKNPLIQASRDAAMAQIISLNIVSSSFYCLCSVSSLIINFV